MSEIHYPIFVLKYSFRVVHMFSYAMVFGNVSYDLFMGRRAQPESSDENLYFYLMLAFYVLIIISGIANMVLLIIENKYIKDFNYELWKKSLVVKFLLTIFMTPALEGLIALGIDDRDRVNRIADPIKFSIMLVFVLGSSFLRYFREKKLIVEEVYEDMKNDE